MRIFIIRMNNAKPPFDNVNARKCFAHAFNYDGFIQEILKGYAERDPTPMPNKLWGFPKDAAGYDYDLKKAKEFYQKAVGRGRADEAADRDPHPVSSWSRPTQAAQLFQSRSRDPRHQPQDRRRHLGQYHDERPASRRPRPDMWIHWVSTYFVDPENWVGQMYDSQFHGTWKASAWYKNPKVDELLRKARGLVEQERARSRSTRRRPG